MIFRAKKKISERNAYNMVVNMAIHGNHYNDIHGLIKNISDVKRHLSQNNIEFKKVIEHCRVFSQSVPVYENLIGPTMRTHGVKVQRPNHITGEYETIIDGDGEINENNYWALFEISKEDFENSIKSGSRERFLAAVNAGIAAIESFLNHQYMILKKVSEENPALRHNLERKIKEWPIELTEKKFPLLGKNWSTFLHLKKMRDENFQHMKTTSTGITNKDTLSNLNSFKHGIPRLIFDLHIHFKCRCPCSIIRMCHYPEIELVQEKLEI
jgi:hypothetical protein